ncbi:L-rhamnose mutarotase [Paenibacillus eucommiae]|uniref:L-rhamnose mutarotase n=1 Tax=Paenibacillus eucommiae TaxID=1355755 RepID=A0ABS4J021_9BACL|nr:L-rhamnose mutarotase [Paenibacillus eucommiae]MBP1993188.1 L-rhamnose mutarotase [Paenibacillus eucommiae]
MIKQALRVAVLHPDKIEEYERLHNEIPEQIERHMKEAGCKKLHIFRQGTHLWMYVELDESEAVAGRIVDEEMEREWHALTGDCFVNMWQEVPMVYSFISEQQSGHTD